MDKLEKQTCPICGTNNLTLTEDEKEVPYFGKVFIFAMVCSSCKYHKADVECAERKDPARYTLEITSENDMKIRVVKSSEATVKVPYIGSIEPGPDSNGDVTNVEGILTRFKEQIESLKNDAEDEEDRKKAKNLLKKLTRIMWGQEKVVLTVEDPTGNSAIISEKAKITKLKQA